MPTLHWIGKEAVTNHHKDVPYRMLEPDAKLSHGEDGGDGNLIVQGDNLHALKALLPKYAGKVKCIYIDPPYNTGNEGWVYNDNVKAPEIQKWLGQVVGKEAEDLSRHDKWLCMMYPRLVLLKQFLSEDGAIFVSIDDNEVGSLRLLMDEVWGGNKFIASFVWQKRYSRENREAIGDAHEYLLCYGLNIENFKHSRGLIPLAEKQKALYKNPDNDPNGLWQSVSMTAQGYRPNQMYQIEAPNGNIHIPPEGRCWSTIQSEYEKLKAKKCIYFGADGNGVPRIKRYLKDSKGLVPWTWLPHEEVGHTGESRIEIRSIFGSQTVFDTPKPTRLIQRVLQIATDKDSIILDSFAGSGTTAHAVLKQNAGDGGNRKFILCEMEENIAENITRKRVLRVADGYTDSKGKAVAGLGGSFQYCRLSEEPLFNADGRVRPDVNFDQLAEFVWYNETGKGWHGWEEGKKKTKKKAKPSELGPIFDTSGQIRSYPRGPLLGVENGHAFVLLYNGILSDRSDLGGNVLTQRTLDYLRETIDHDGHMTVFAARNRFANKRLREQGITYKQLPYRIDT